MKKIRFYVKSSTEMKQSGNYNTNVLLRDENGIMPDLSLWIKTKSFWETHTDETPSIIELIEGTFSIVTKELEDDKKIRCIVPKG